MVPWAHTSQPPKRNLDWFSNFAKLMIMTNGQTDRQTDHATPSVATGCI